VKLSVIAQFIGGKLIGKDIEVCSIKSLVSAGEKDLSILLDKSNIKDARQTKAGALVSFVEQLKPSNIILVDNCRAIFPRLLGLFEERNELLGISSMASIEKGVELGEGVAIDAFVKIRKQTKIGKNTQIFSGVVIGCNVEIGENTIIYPNVTIYDNSIIGRGCILHSGCVIGADGFGFERNKLKEWDKVPQIAKVVIGDNVEIGANSCVDRGAIQDTVIGEGTKIDNLVQVGHNCLIGKHNVFSSMAAIAGSTTIGDYNMWGGQTGSTGHIKIEDNVVVMARAGLTKDTPSNGTMLGFPAQEYRKELREQAVIRRLAKKELNITKAGGK